jgi:hypothetical protein
MKTEQELANELDAFLTARLKGRSVTTSEEVQSAARLVSALLDVAKRTEPDPIFLSSLEAQLARAASRQQKQKKAPERPSFWQQLLTTVEETFTVRRTVFALGTIVALIIVGIFALNILFPNDGTEPAAIADVTQVETEESSETIAEAVPEAALDTSNLRPLPNLAVGGFGGGGGGFGGGGGGEIALSEPITDANGDLSFRPYNPLSDTVYLMNAPLPVESTSAAVYEQPGENSLNLEDVRHFANLFRMGGEIYTETYPEFEPAPGEPAWTPPTSYFMFDGPRTLSVWGSNLQYYDQSAAPNFTAELMAYEQALPIAEAFLRDRGLLDFDYQLIPPQFSGNEVNFHRVVDGRVVNAPEYTVSVNNAGQVLSVYYNPLHKLQSLGTYPLRSAESAWQQVTTEGIDYQRSYFITYPGPDYEFPEEPIPVDGPYKYWQRTYQDGETLNIFTSPLVYQPVDSNAAPRIQADQFILVGSDEVLRAIGEQRGQQIRVTGTVRHVDSALNLEVSDWQVVEFIDYQYQPGTIRQDEGQTLLEADSGETFLIPNAPADLAAGERVNVNGWFIEPGDPYGVFNWQGIDRIVEFEALPADIVTDPALAEPYKIGQVEITSVELIYVYVPYTEEGRTDVRILLQPAWRFKGTTDTKEIIEFVVQAVTDEFIAGDQ